MMSLRCLVFTAATAALLRGGAYPVAGQEASPPVETEKPAEKPARTSSPEAVKAMKDGVEAMRQRDWKKALTAWQETVKLEPANAGAWANLGKIQLQQKQLPAATASLEKAVALQPALAEAWLALGMAYDAGEAPMRAVSCLTRAVHENPTDARTRNSLAILLKKVGWGGAAETELQKALDLDPRYAEAHFNLAVMYLERKPPLLEMARRHYDAARELGAAPDKEMETQLAAADPGPEESAAEPPPPAPKLPANSKPKPKTTRNKP